MANQKPQSFENHVRQIPIFALGNLALFVNLVGRLVDLRHGISFGPVMDVLVSAALIALFVMGRNSVVAVQDRVIRLEMRLRLAGVLPPDLCSRIPELPELARKVLDEKLDDRKAIKKLIKNWQADYLRA